MIGGGAVESGSGVGDATALVVVEVGAPLPSENDVDDADLENHDDNGLVVADGAEIEAATSVEAAAAGDIGAASEEETEGTGFAEGPFGLLKQLSHTLCLDVLWICGNTIELFEWSPHTTPPHFLQ